MGTRYEVITGLIDEMVDPSLPKAEVENTPLYWLNQWLSAGIALEPDTDDLTLRGPITRWVGLVFGKPRMTKTEALEVLADPIQPGDPNPFFQVIDSVSREGGTVAPGATPFAMAYAEPVTRELWKTPQYAAALVLTGGDAIDLEVWFEIDSPDDDCPLQPGTPWSEWGQGGANDELANPVGEKYYRTNADYGSPNSGKKIPASQWVPLYMQGQLKVLSKAEYQAVVAANTAPPN